MATRVDGVEPALAGIWAEVLDVEHVAPDDDFFTLGGTSLLAMQIVARASEAFGVELELDVLFEAPTVAGMAVAIGAGANGASPRGGAAKARGARRGLFGRGRAEVPLVSPLQASAWAVQRFVPTARPHVGEVYRLEGPLDVGALERALSELVARHEILRTVFPLVDYRPQPRVLAPEPVRVPVVALPRGGRQRADAELHALVNAARSDPFEYETTPPLRIRLIQRGPASHVLAILTHEMVCDGWGFDALVRELSLLYRAFATGRSPPFEGPPLQYGDVLREQAERAAARAAEDRAHWRHELAAAPLTIPLPFETGGRPAGRDDAAQAFGTVPGTVSAALAELARSTAATSFMVHLAAFYVLLHRHTGEPRLLVTAPAANRARTELEQVIGFFARILPLAVALGDDPSFRTLLQRTREATLQAFAHADGLPEDNRLRELTGLRGLRGNGCVFRLWDATLERRLELADVRAQPYGEGGEGSVVAAIVTEAPGRETRVELSTTTLGKATADALLEHYLRILAQAGEDPDRSIGALELLSEGERRQLVSGWNPGRGDPTDARCLHELVEAQARRAPDAVAVGSPSVDGWEELTYGELDARATTRAEELRAGGAGRTGDLLSLPPSAQLVVELLAVLKAGGTIGGGADRANAGGERPVDADDVAIVIPTAGTTAWPKRVELTHRALVHATAWRQHAYRLAPGERAVHVPGPGVLAWALTPWAYLACGAQVIVPSRAPEAPGPRVAHWFAEQDATLAAVSPMLATSFLTSPDAERSTLRTLLVHGVGVPTLPLRRGSRMNVFREYVIAEAGGLVLSSRVRAGDAGDTPFASESPAALGAQAYVLDAHGRLLTPGAVGELHLGGTGIARGYAGEPERTARTFVPDPLGADPGARLVRTGDLARRRLDGSLELLGRTQDEVRFRGFRLNPCLEELEQALAEHPSVAAAAAGWDAEDELLIGYVVSRRGLAPEPAELDAWLQQRVADWTLPGRYVAIPSLPLRPDGSLDRAALGELTERQPLGDEDPARTAPRTRVEKKLQAVWKKVLGRRDVGVHDSFFALGGDLALGIEMVERAGAAGIAVSTEGLMFRPTIAELAAVAERSS